VDWGCGTCCTEFAIVDAQDGRVRFPRAISVARCVMPLDSQDAPLIQYRLDSKLMILTGATDKLKGGRYFYLWNGIDLKLIFSIAQGSDGTIPAQ